LLCITGLLGVFLLAIWAQDRSVRALAWWGGAYLIGASAVTLWWNDDPLSFVTPDLPNILLFVACGVIWNGARLFHGRPVKLMGLCAGSVVWAVAIYFPGFASASHGRVALACLIIASYAFLTAHEFRHDRRRRAFATRCLAFVVPLMHSTVFLSPIALSLALPDDSSSDGLLALFALETVLYAVGTAFMVVVMAKERLVLLHKTAAMTDPLTGLFNRRAFMEAADRVVAQRARKALPVSILLFDLDHFKSINDRFGHAVGDDTLRLFARTIHTTLRTTDIMGRFGGEEFLALLPAGASEAAIAAERVRNAFQTVAVEVSGHSLRATVSIGIAAASAPVVIATLLQRADRALYRAKSNGRNRIEQAVPEDAGLPAPMPPVSLPVSGRASMPAINAATVAMT
jgi:diguanylate cyclase (GGDEF)-like protein